MNNTNLTQAFILAAGFGTRLYPLTKDTPKALVKINNKPMLEMLINKLINSGIQKIVINTHHLANKIDEFICNKKFNAEIILSHENQILDTGGGILNAKKYFDLNKNLLIHNVDIISDLDFKLLNNFHTNKKAIATLFVQNRKTSRYLLFDKNLTLSGWINKKTNEKIISRPQNTYKELAFNGIHIISPEIFDLFTETGKFSIIPQYLNIAKNNTIAAFENKNYYWQDLGKIETLKQIEKDIIRLNL